LNNFALTLAHNGRTYLFSRDRVYEVWRHDNLQQKTSFYINEMFPKGPRTVSVAYTNARSGVTVLIERTNVYRFRWNRDKKHFHIVQIGPAAIKYCQSGQHVRFGDAPQQKDRMKDKNWFEVLAEVRRSKEDYFRNLPNDMIGMTLKTQTLLIVYTASNTVQACRSTRGWNARNLQLVKKSVTKTDANCAIALLSLIKTIELKSVYDTKKHRIVQEYPIETNKLVGCINE
uniref:Uncharacterized protein n=1 Tax=Parascaris equorum TaxID=6256 RepID=A0A914S1Z4_PAREQ